jgi:hypothetical protein
MKELISALLKQPHWVIALLLGVLLIGSACTTIGKDKVWETHGPTTYWLAGPGVGLLLLSLVGFGFTQLPRHGANGDHSGAGLDITRVKERNGALCTTVAGCEIRVVNGRIEDYPQEPAITIVLPCNEYFDDDCAHDPRSALGACVNRVFKGQADAFVSLMKEESRRQLGPGERQKKTHQEDGESLGTGQCVLLDSPLNRSVPVALVSTTTQRAGEGLAARISYLFDGMRNLAMRLADARLNDIAMPILGAGHGGIDPPLAFVGLVLALAEAARYGHGAQRLKRATIVVFQAGHDKAPQIDPVVVRRALALIGSKD